MSLDLAERTSLEQRWETLRTEVQQRWPQLDDSDLEAIDGNSQKLIALIYQRTGQRIDAIEDAVADIAAQSGGLMSRVTRLASEAGESVSRRVGPPIAQGRGALEGKIRHNPDRAVAIAFGIGLVCGIALTHRR